MESRVLTIALGWLLFPDLWSHVKKSIPWLKYETGADLAVAYNRTEEA